MEKKSYNPKEIEAKWQRRWKEERSFQVQSEERRPKYYVLDMFPYPSGAGLHVGHLVGYTATDVVARFKRHLGYNVLHPMGWDSFGLPAEQYALRTGTHPAETTARNVKRFKEQLERLGFSYDWDRELSTSDIKYYRWTQWIFTKLYERGLAYEADLHVNYCPQLGTVLANEEVENGFSKEGGFPVERRLLRQWVLKITAYADRLLKDLEGLDWPESLKRLQINWIGRSEGTLVHFETEAHEVLSVFTTCPETLFGVTFLVLAPEHPLVGVLTTEEQRPVVERYQKESGLKSDLMRTDLAKEKSGVFTGGYVVHPVTGRRVPVWVADYVLASYGTGAVMGVPGHDERDRTFAERYGLEILSVVTEEGRCQNSVGGGLSLDGLTEEEGYEVATEWLVAKGRGRREVHYKLRDWLFSRQRYWGEPIPILHFGDGSQRALRLDELPLALPRIEDYKPMASGESPLAKAKEWVEVVDGGKPALRETNTMPNWAGSCWYYLRFCDPHNEAAAWGRGEERYWMPVDLYVGGVEHAVLHLLYARFWHKVLFDIGEVSTAEPFQALRNQGLVVARAYRRANGLYVPPEDVIEQGGHYFHKETGEALVSQVEKMSKSKLNGVSPDEMCDLYGADALRLYALFMGPLEKEKVWNGEAISGCRRFLQRFFDLVHSSKVGDGAPEEKELALIHRLIRDVRSDYEALSFNTAIAKMMETLNQLAQLERLTKSLLRKMVILLSPMAPHVAEELWEVLGGTHSLVEEPFPVAEERYCVAGVVTYVVQVDGKVRGRFELPKDQPQEEIVRLARAHPHIQTYLTQAESKIIFVPNKLINFVL